MCMYEVEYICLKEEKYFLGQNDQTKLTRHLLFGFWLINFLLSF